MKKISLFRSFLELLILGLSAFFCITSSYADSIKNQKFDLSIEEVKKITSERSHLVEKLDNNYNINFLPQTQLIDLTISKYDLNFNIDERLYIENINLQPHPFYIDLFGNSLILTDKLGRIFMIDEVLFQNNKNNINLNKFITKTNLKKEISVLDTYILGSDIFISYSYGDINCKKFAISRANINQSYLSFVEIFAPSECSKVVMGGRMMQFINNSSEGLLITTSSENNDVPDNRAQEKNSIYGKTLFLDLRTLDYTIYSLGHRNAQGLYVDGNLVIETEHGPRGGDEINIIVKGGNYGWPISSYGEKYGPKKLFATYEKEHNKLGFQEPIYAFVPSIAIGEIIKIPKQFSQFWDNNFLVASLNKKNLYRVKFSSDFSRVLFVEPIYIGSRIRDMKFSGNGERLYLALEMPNQVMVLSNYLTK